jgi:DNA (cytosine-5)-methyltransferase 1
MKHPLRFIDLFAGIGGLRLGVEQALAQADVASACVLTCEIDKHAKTTYEANFLCQNFATDITQLHEHDVPQHDLLLAGFPCQPFSQAGLKQGFADTRGTLFFDIERILKHHKPSLFLLENVKQLQGHDKGRTINVILEHLTALGYGVHYQVLNAKHYGIPQNRERIYIVGFLDPVASQRFSFPQPLMVPTTVGQVLEPLVADKYTLSTALWQGHQRRKEQHKAKGNGFGYSLFKADSPYASTLSARYYKDGSEILIDQSNANPRKVTPREAARLQGFPDSFALPVSDCQAYKQLGNSVPVPVVQAVVEQMMLAVTSQVLPTTPVYSHQLQLSLAC